LVTNNRCFVLITFTHKRNSPQPLTRLTKAFSANDWSTEWYCHMPINKKNTRIRNLSAALLYP